MCSYKSKCRVWVFHRSVVYSNISVQDYNIKLIILYFNYYARNDLVLCVDYIIKMWNSIIFNFTKNKLHFIQTHSSYPSSDSFCFCISGEIQYLDVISERFVHFELKTLFQLLSSHSLKLMKNNGQTIWYRIDYWIFFSKKSIFSVI